MNSKLAKTLLVASILVSATPAFASFYMECGTTTGGQPEVKLNIEDEDIAGGWGLYLYGKKAFSLDAPTIVTKHNTVTVTIQTSDSTWRGYEFFDKGNFNSGNPASCAAYNPDIYSADLTVYDVRVDGQKEIQKMKCNCVED